MNLKEIMENVKEAVTGGEDGAAGAGYLSREEDDLRETSAQGLAAFGALSHNPVTGEGDEDSTFADPLAPRHTGTEVPASEDGEYNSAT